MIEGSQTVNLSENLDNQTTVFVKLRVARRQMKLEQVFFQAFCHMYTWGLEISMGTI